MRKRYKMFAIGICTLCIIIFIGNVCFKQKHENDSLEWNILQQVNYSYVDDKTIATTQEKEEVLINPGKGFVLQSYVGDGYEDIVAVGYVRLDWSDIELDEGQYNWNFLDAYMRSYANKGKKIALGIMCANTASKKKYVTPEWVFEARG